MKQTFQKLFLILAPVTALAILPACQKKEDTASTPEKPFAEQMNEMASATDFTAQIMPNAYSVIKANLTPEDLKERYTVGCQTIGSGYPALQSIDSSLRVGHLFRTVRGEHDPLDNPSQTQQSIRFAQLSSNGYIADTTFEVGPMVQYFAAAPHLRNTFSYTIENGLMKPSYNYEILNLASNTLPGSTSSNRYVSCWFDYDSQAAHPVQIISSDDKIKYTFENRTVTGYLTRTTYTGDIVCERRFYSSSSSETPEGEKVKMGSGQRIAINIHTNDVINEGTYNCGGSRVYSSELMALDSGRVISSHVDKVINAPFR